MSISKRIKVIDINATDNPIELDGKRFAVESTGWNMINLINQGKISELLDYIGENFEHTIPTECGMECARNCLDYCKNDKDINCRKGFNGCDSYKGDSICRCN